MKFSLEIMGSLAMMATTLKSRCRRSERVSPNAADAKRMQSAGELNRAALVETTERSFGVRRAAK